MDSEGYVCTYFYKWDIMDNGSIIGNTVDGPKTTENIIDVNFAEEVVSDVEYNIYKLKLDEDADRIKLLNYCVKAGIIQSFAIPRTLKLGANIATNNSTKLLNLFPNEIIFQIMGYITDRESRINLMSVNKKMCELGRAHYLKKDSLIKMINKGKIDAARCVLRYNQPLMNDRETIIQIVQQIASGKTSTASTMLELIYSNSIKYDAVIKTLYTASKYGLIHFTIMVYMWLKKQKIAEPDLQNIFITVAKLIIRPSCFSNEIGHLLSANSEVSEKNPIICALLCIHNLFDLADKYKSSLDEEHIDMIIRRSKVSRNTDSLIWLSASLLLNQVQFEKCVAWAIKWKYHLLLKSLLTNNGKKYMNKQLYQRSMQSLISRKPLVIGTINYVNYDNTILCLQAFADTK